MSNKSIGSKIQGLEERLRAENEQRNRDDHLLNNASGTAHPRNAGARRPRPMNAMSSRTRPSHMVFPAAAPASQESIETMNRLGEMRSSLTIDGRQYPSDLRDLQHLGELGNGTCGHVVKMLHSPSKAVIAVKQMRKSGNSEENKRILMDLDVVLRCDGCPYIVRCLGCFVTEADVWICMELMASCFDKILKRRGGPVPEEILGKVTVATVKALSYLKEEHGVMHRDVKPSNILVDAKGCIKLCDFGISGRLVDSKAKTRSAGCAAYMAPERIDPPDPQKPDYDIRADVWSLGISLVELATGIFPYRDCQNDFEVLSKVIGEEPPALPENLTFSPEFKSFVQNCLTKNYRNRPKYPALLQHEFVKRSEASGVHVDKWLQDVLPAAQRTESSSSVGCKHHPTNTEDISHNNHKLHITTQFNGSVQSMDASPISDKHILDLTLQQLHTDANTVLLDTSRCNNQSPKPQRTRLQDSSKSSQESPDQSLSESSKASCISIDQNLPLRDSLGSGISTQTEDCESGSFSSMTVEGDSAMHDNSMASVSIENLSVSKQTDDVVVENAQRIPTSPAERPPAPRIPRNNTPELYIRQQNYTPTIGNSPKEYYLQQRVRSLSNTMVYGNPPVERAPPPPRFVTGSPNTNNYFANLEIRNQPFSGGGPSSFDGYTNHDSGDYQAAAYPRYGSPEVARRQYFSPSRNGRVPVHPGYEYGPSQPHPNVVSPPNFILGYENVPDSRFSPPCFRANGATNYFTSTAVCTMSRFGPPQTMGPQQGMPMGGGGYHHNPGGSCSQPASLEAYGDTRHYSPYVHARPPEKTHSPALWSPQPVARRSAVRDREDRWRSEAQHHHPQVPGNTSPIVLQRFYHQQGQRRSRRDARDGSPRQRSSVSREASVGRSPEPPRRAHRDPSTGRNDTPALPMDQQSILERLEKERERIPQIPTDLHIPDMRQPPRDREKQQQQQPDLIRPHHRCERDGRDNDSPCSESVARERFEPRRRDKKEDINGGEKEDSLCSPRERFEHHMQERKNNKEMYSFPRERRDEPNGDVNRSNRDDNSRLSPVMSHRHGKGHKDKDEQAGGGQSSPLLDHGGGGGGGSKDSGHSRTSRFGGIPRRIADSDAESVMSDRRQKDVGHSYVPGFRRYGSGIPQPPPRRSAESWSLPGSPLPARPS